METLTRIGVCQWSLDRPGTDALGRAAELGFEAIHLDGGLLAEDATADPGLASVEAYRDVASETGVQIVAVAPGRLNQLGLTSPAGSENARSCERSIAAAILAAARLGAPLIYLPSFANGEIHDAEDLRRTAQVMQTTCDIAAGHGISVATENTLGAAATLRLLAMVDRPNAQVLLDTQNPVLWGHDVASYVDSLWPHLANQVHVKDGCDGAMGNAALGEGEAGFVATVAALQAHGFDGSLISENDYTGARVARAGQDIALLARSFRPGS